MTKGIKTSEFWSHIAVIAGSVGTVLGTIFDKTFLNNHPLIAGLVAGGGLLAAGIATAAYSISRGLVKSSTTSIDATNATTLPIA